MTERINQIIEHKLFIENLRENEAAEADRRFCRHDMAHFLDVARIAMIINFEEGMKVRGELIYAAALLHDIGKHRQYGEGIPHERAGAAIAPGILKDCGFDEEETRVITDAVLQHRDSRVIAERSLAGLLYRADKKSRPCFACKAREECDWPDGKKSRLLAY